MGVFYNLCTDGVIVDVLKQGQKVTVTVTQNRLVSALKQMADCPVFAVEVHGVTLVDALKDLGERRFPCFDQQMNMISHENVGIQMVVVAGPVVGEELKIVAIVSRLFEDLLPLITAADYMVEGSFKLYPQLPGHARSLADRPFTVKIAIFKSDPMIILFAYFPLVMIYKVHQNYREDAKRGMRKIWLVVPAVLLLISCSKGPDGKASGDYIAKVGPEVITKDYIQKRLDAVPEYARNMYEGEEGMRKVVDDLVKTELIYLEAKKEGLDKDPDFVAKVEDYRKFALVNMLLEKVIGTKQTITEKDARRYYDENKDKFSLEQVRASHILVKTREDADAVVKELREGKNFEALAKAKSADTESAKKGGDLGFFKKGEMVPEFENAAFNLKKGEVSQPVKSQFGYHIIKMTDRKAGAVVDFAKVKDVLIQRLEQEKQKEAFDAFLEKIKAKYPVQINDERLKELAAATSGKDTGKPK